MAATAATNVDLPAAFAVGEVLAGKYLVERVLGSGGLCYVLAARNPDLDQIVAIKCLRGEFSRSSTVSCAKESSPRRSRARTSSACSTSRARPTAHRSSEWSTSRASI